MIQQRYRTYRTYRYRYRYRYRTFTIL